MSTTADLIAALKKELKTAQMTYADLAQALGMAESSVKRMLAKGDMPLSRIDAICRALKLDFADLARRVADAQPLLAQLTQEQERAVVADKKLLLVAICVLSQWTLEQIVAAFGQDRLGVKLDPPERRGYMFYRHDDAAFGSSSNPKFRRSCTVDDGEGMISSCAKRAWHTVEHHRVVV